MLKMSEFGAILEQIGFNFYSGVPCSFLKPMINYAINRKQFVMGANEGDAVAICAGAYLGGKKPIFLCQNSGLTNAVSPLTSLNYTFEIPVLGFVSLRGEPGLSDEPQHELMGTITEELLDVMKIKNEILSNDLATAKIQLERANDIIECGQSFFFVVRNNTFDKETLKEQTAKHVEKQRKTINDSLSLSARHKRIEVLKELKNNTDEDTLLLATTGVTGRELFEIEDTANQFYMVGSMGCISSVALGLAIAQPTKKIIAIDGDGSLLMRMGSLATNAYYAPENLYHLLLDNNLHESTGGQKTVSENVSFVEVAAGTGYEKVEILESLDDIKISIDNWKNKQQLTFGYMRIMPGIKEGLGRPTVTPIEVKSRLIKYIKGENE